MDARPRADADALSVTPDEDLGVPGRLPECVLRGDGRSDGLGDARGELRGLGRGERGLREAIWRRPSQLRRAYGTRALVGGCQGLQLGLYHFHLPKPDISRPA